VFILLNMCEYIYLLQEREFIVTEQDIFKIGKSRQNNLERISQYPNGTQLVMQIRCKNCDLTESKLIALFAKKFKRRRDIGLEYFEGNYHEMIRNIFEEIEGKPKIQKQEVYIIDSYIKFKKVSNIHQIVITDKNMQSGYAKVSMTSDNSCKLFTIGNQGSDDDLTNFIDRQLDNVSLCKSNITDEIVVTNKVNKLRNFENNYIDCNYIIDYNKLINDICIINYDPLYFANTFSEESDKNERSIVRSYTRYVVIYIYFIVIFIILVN
jgi:hypothetical protein